MPAKRWAFPAGRRVGVPSGSGAPRGEPLDAMGRVGLLKRSGAGACPNLLQRRPATGSTTRRSAEYQRFFSRAPARSGPLQQIWTNGAASGPSPRGGRRLDGDHDEHPDGRMGSRERRPVASTSLDPRARLLEVRARGSSDVLAAGVLSGPRRALSEPDRAGTRRSGPSPQRRRTRRGRDRTRTCRARRRRPGGREHGSGPRPRAGSGLRNASPAQHSPPRLAPCEPSATEST